jgi:hypothetical protein
MSRTNLSVSVVAGDITATTQPPREDIGQQVKMGDDLYFHIKPDVARQWIGVLESIAAKDSK